jgi:non-ribosomal peptide synthetase component F
MENAFEFQPYDHAAIEQSIPERFQQQVAKHAGRIAIRTPGRCWTYDALNIAANQVANALIEELGADQEPVALLMEQSAEAAISILGILKAGKFYLPLDTASPLIRLGKQLQSARPRLILTEPRHLEWASSLGESCGAVAALTETLLKAPKTVNPELDLTPERLAYLFFTSGSTGEPKGVVDSHRNVMHNVIRYTNGLRIGPDDRLSLIQSPSFSGTASSLFSALLNGATVCPFNVRREGFQALSSWVNDMGISVYHSVPAIFRGLTLGNQRFPSVRTVRLEGDQALPADVELYRRFFSDSCLLAVGLGATETGLSCQYIINQQQPLPSVGVPLGYPTQDMSISIIDDDGRDVGPLAAGEIAVRSCYLAVGYWHQPERSSRRQSSG